MISALRTLPPAKAVLLFIALISLIRLLVAPQFGLGVDEAHYALYGRYLDWSYFDHPPLVGWVHALFGLVGKGEFILRLPAILIGALTSWLIYVLMRNLSEDERIALWGVIALNASPMINALFLMLLPDTLLMPLLVLIVLLLQKMEKEATLSTWIFLGILLGVAGLAKYSAVLFIPPLLLYLLIQKRFDLLFNPRILPSALIAFILIIPVIYWNIQHEWISFSYQGDHVLGESHIDWSAFGKSLGAQFGVYSPPLFLLSVAAFFKAFQLREKSLQPILFLSGFLAAFFLYSSLYKTVLPHWSIQVYLLLIPLSVLLFWRYQKILRWSIGVSLVIVLLAYFELGFKLFIFEDYKSAHRDIYGWPEMMQKADTLASAHQNPHKAIGVHNWTQGSRALYYNPGSTPVYVMDKRQDQFDLWEKESPIGKDILFINTHFAHTPITNKAKCAKIEEVDSIDLVLRGHKINDASYVWCYHFQGLK